VWGANTLDTHTHILLFMIVAKVKLMCCLFMDWLAGLGGWLAGQAGLVGWLARWAGWLVC
jgi:hypothetical protein